ncbi:MAG: T9SS type A sorting domain-containing protein [Bacteroidia bacterium]
MKFKSTFYISFLFILCSLSTFAANYFWVGGSGSWSDYGVHWATSSGGTVFHTQVPQSTDNVFFDANSFNASAQTVTVDQPIVQCANMNWTGVTNLPTFAGDYSNTLKIYGSFTLSNNMQFAFEGPISFESTTSGKTITTYNKFISSSLSFNGIGGAWTLIDDLKTTWIYLNNGTLNTNNKSINAYAFRSTTSATRALNLGSSVISLSFYGPMWNINPTGMSLNAGTSTIKGVAQSGGAQDFYGGGFNYNNVYFTGSQAGKINGNSNINNVSFAADGYIQCNCNFNDVTFSADAFFMEGSSFNNVVISKNGNFASSNTFQNLTLSPGQSYILSSSETQTINQTLTANGTCGDLIDISSSVSGVQSNINKTAGSVLVNYVSLKDVNATGGATFIANNTSNVGNNTGWTINSIAAKNLYWIGNSGNWNDGNHWSLTSGGAPAGCAPSPVDNVIFDANSFTQTNATVLVNVPVAAVNDMTWINVANTPEFYGDYSNSLKIYGSLTLCSGINFNYSGLLSFDATTGNKTITTAGNAINTSIWFNGSGGEWTLQDNLTCNYWIYLNRGTLNTNNKTVNAYAFNSTTSSTRALNMGASIFNLSFNGSIWQINSTGITINSGTSHIYGVGFSGGEQYFIGGGFVYNNLSFIGAALGKVIDSNTMQNVYFGADGFIQGGSFNNVDFTADATLYYTNICNQVKIGKNAKVYGSNTFNTLELTPGYTYTLAAGETQTINNSLIATGSCGGLIEIRSGTPGVQTTISKAAGLVELAYLSLKDVAVTGGATFIANTSNDLGNNIGWSTATTSTLLAKNLYWIGNSGNWSDGNHWSLTSGGVPSGCSPTPIDNAYFDANSFSSPNQTVTVNVPNAFVNDMIWTGVINAPTFYGDYTNTLKIYGSLALAQGVNFNFTGSLLFEATTTGKTITTAGAAINTSIVFNGIGGSWTLQDNLTCNYWIYLNNGTLNTNNKTINAYAFNSNTNSSRVLNLGASVINLSFNGLIWKINPTGMALNAGTSIIKGIGVSGGQQDFLGGGFTYNNILFTGAALGKIVDNNTINDLSFSADGFIQGGQFHDITFSGNATMYYTNTCNNVSIAKDATIYGSNTFYFLKLSPGYTYTFTAGETQTILPGGNICAEGTGSLPIRIQSSLPGVPTTISKPDGGVCWNYVRISDISAIGGAIFNAGLAPDNSEDMGGNAGFIYTGNCFPLGCAPCVAPSITTQPASAQICTANNVTFTIAATGSGLSYQWQVLQGSTYVNIANNSIYSGVNSNTLVISNTTGLNGYKYRCTVQGFCGNPLVSNIATLTINPQPIVSATVNGSAINVTATGGTAPYSGIGTFNVTASGSYTYTVTDAKGCAGNTTVNITINPTNDITPPVAICKNATLTLSNGTATLNANQINNGSYDNVGIASITVSPNTFTCASIGVKTVVLTVKDIAGNTSTCQAQVTIIGSIPTVTITQSGLPDFWQGSGLILTANANQGVTYLWNSGETTNTKNVSNSGTSSVTVKNNYGCSATASLTVNYNASALASSYTLIGKEEITLDQSSFVQSGAAGVMKHNGDIDVKSGSKITGAGTFATAKYIYVSSSSTVTQKIYTPASITLPIYKLNPYCSSSYSNNCNGNQSTNNSNSWSYYGNNNGCNNNNWNNYCNNNGNNNNSWNNNNCNNGNNNWNNNNCNNGGNGNNNQGGANKIVSNNSTVILTDSIYGDIVIGSNATVTFNKPVIYMKSITTGANTKINFNGCTEIRICGKVVFGEYNVFNLAAKGVVMYCDEEVEIKKGTNFTAAIYTKKDLQTEGTCNARITMKGMFIANKVKSDYTTWNWNNSTSGCTFTRSASLDNESEYPENEGSVVEEMDVNVFPNPSTDNFSVVLNSENTAPYTVTVYDMGGRLIYSNTNVEAIEVLSFGQNLQKGIYLMTVTQAYNSKTLRIVKTQ